MNNNFKHVVIVSSLALVAVLFVSLFTLFSYVSPNFFKAAELGSITTTSSPSPSQPPTCQSCPSGDSVERDPNTGKPVACCVGTVCEDPSGKDECLPYGTLCSAPPQPSPKPTPNISFHCNSQDQCVQGTGSASCDPVYGPACCVKDTETVCGGGKSPDGKSITQACCDNTKTNCYIQPTYDLSNPFIETALPITGYRGDCCPTVNKIEPDFLVQSDPNSEELTPFVFGQKSQVCGTGLNQTCCKENETCVNGKCITGNNCCACFYSVTEDGDCSSFSASQEECQSGGPHEYNSNPLNQTQISCVWVPVAKGYLPDIFPNGGYCTSLSHQKCDDILKKSDCNVIKTFNENYCSNGPNKSNSVKDFFDNNSCATRTIYLETHGSSGMCNLDTKGAFSTSITGTCNCVGKSCAAASVFSDQCSVFSNQVAVDKLGSDFIAWAVKNNIDKNTIYTIRANQSYQICSGVANTWETLTIKYNFIQNKWVVSKTYIPCSEVEGTYCPGDLYDAAQNQKIHCTGSNNNVQNLQCVYAPASNVDANKCSSGTWQWNSVSGS